MWYTPSAIRQAGASGQAHPAAKAVPVPFGSTLSADVDSISVGFNYCNKRIVSLIKRQQMSFLADYFSSGIRFAV
jgi:hypothetical protein